MATSIISAITYARQLCQTDSNGLSDTLGLNFANDALQNTIRSMVERDINAAQTVESYTSLPTTGKFSFPSDMWALKTIEVNYLDSTQNNYIQAENVELANIQQKSFDWLRVNQSTTSPLFANSGDTGELFPTPASAVAQGLKIIYFQIPTEYPDVGTAITYPITLDYRMIGARIASLYQLTLTNFSSAEAFQAEYERRLKDVIRILAPASQQPIQAQPIQITGWRF